MLLMLPVLWADGCWKFSCRKKKGTTVSVLHVSADLLRKDIALWLLIGECDKMRKH